MNDLERELNVLTAIHKTLQDEAKKKGTGLQKANSYATLQEENDKLQKVHPSSLSFSFVSVCLSLCLCLSIDI